MTEEKQINYETSTAKAVGMTVGLLAIYGAIAICVMDPGQKMLEEQRQAEAAKTEGLALKVEADDTQSPYSEMQTGQSYSNQEWACPEVYMTTCTDDGLLELKIRNHQQ